MSEAFRHRSGLRSLVAKMTVSRARTHARSSKCALSHTSPWRSTRVYTANVAFRFPCF